MLLLTSATVLAFALAVAVVPLARYAQRQVGEMPPSSRVTIFAGTAAVWGVGLAGAIMLAMRIDPRWTPCAIAAACLVGMLALVVFTTSAKEEQERWRDALAKLGATGPINEQPWRVRLEAWAMSMEHNGVMARAARVLMPVLLAVLLTMWWFFEGVDW